MIVVLPPDFLCLIVLELRMQGFSCCHFLVMALTLALDRTGKRFQSQFSATVAYTEYAVLHRGNRFNAAIAIGVFRSKLAVSKILRRIGFQKKHCNIPHRVADYVESW